MKETVVVLSAHNDDFVLGAGGTIKNYTQKGHKVIAVVFSYGELSHPWLKEEVVRKMRKEETDNASNLLKNKVLMYNLREGKFLDKREEATKNLVKLFRKEKPTKLFTHSSEDPHPDHKAVNKITLDVYDLLDDKPEVYTYSVWNPVSFKTKFPTLCIDVTRTFKAKMKALRLFTSQQFHIAYPVFMVWFRALKDSFRVKGRFAEKFYRIR